MFGKSIESARCACAAEKIEKYDYSQADFIEKCTATGKNIETCLHLWKTKNEGNLSKTNYADIMSIPTEELIKTVKVIAPIKPILVFYVGKDQEKEKELEKAGGIFVLNYIELYEIAKYTFIYKSGTYFAVAY